MLILSSTSCVVSFMWLWRQLCQLFYQYIQCIGHKGKSIPILLVNIHAPMNGRKSTQLQTKGKNAAPFLHFAESLPSQVRAIYCTYCWRAEFYILLPRYCICLLTLRTRSVFMIIQSFYIPGSAFIDIKQVNRLVREAFVCVCGNSVCVWVCVNSFSHACIHLHYVFPTYLYIFLLACSV